MVTNKRISLGNPNRSAHVFDCLAENICPECGGPLLSSGLDAIEANCPSCGWSSVYRRSSFLSRKLQRIIQGKTNSIPYLAPDLTERILAELPMSDYRYNHRYPFFVHRNARRFRVLGDVADPAEPQARLARGIPVVQGPESRVIRGVDFLKVSFWVRWTLDERQFLGLLDAKKKQVQETEDKDCIPVFKENGFDWNLYRTGTAKYNFRLRSGDITLMFNKRKHDRQIPNCRLEIGSLSCWSPGFFAIYERVKAFLTAYGAEFTKERISEVHLAADFVGTDIQTISIENPNQWIVLTRKDIDRGNIKPMPCTDPDELDFDKHYSCRKFSSMNIGKGDLMLRIYNKVKELKDTRATHKQQLFSELWGVAKYDETSVTRVEYQLRRPKLREFADHEDKRIDTLADLMQAFRSLWQYMTTSWARHAEKAVNRNHNQTKAKISEFWQQVQGVVWTGVFGYVRTHPVKHRDTNQLRSMARGCLMSVCASLEVEPDDIDRIVHLCKDMIEEDLHRLFENEVDFIDSMTTRRNEFRATLAG